MKKNYDNLKRNTFHTKLTMLLITLGWEESQAQGRALCPQAGPGPRNARESLPAQNLGWLTSCTCPAGQPGFWLMTWRHRRAH